MIAPLPTFIFSILAFVVEYLRILQATFPRGIIPPPPLPLDALLPGIEQFLNLCSRLIVPVHGIIRRHYDGNRWVIPVERSVWNTLVIRPEHFWLLTGESPGSLTRVIERIDPDIEARVRNPWNPRRRVRRTRPNALCLHDRFLLTFIWLREYHTLTTLGRMFSVSASNVYDTVFTIVLILFEHYVDRYVTWNDKDSWNNQRGEFEEFPNAVGAIDAFSVQISRPTGDTQRLYYRRDRGYHFLNFHVVIDNDGFYQFSRGGYLGHATDAASFERLPSMGYVQQLHLPRNAYLLADGGYPSVNPLVTPFRRPRGGRLDGIRYRANLELGRARIRGEHRIGDARVYRAVPGRSGRYRGRRYFVAVVVNVVLAIVNRRRRLIRNIRLTFLVHEM